MAKVFPLFTHRGRRRQSDTSCSKQNDNHAKGSAKLHGRPTMSFHCWALNPLSEGKLLPLCGGTPERLDNSLTLNGYLLCEDVVGVVEWKSVSHSSKRIVFLVASGYSDTHRSKPFPLQRLGDRFPLGSSLWLADCLYNAVSYNAKLQNGINSDPRDLSSNFG
jgi:hypothetical protein